MHAFQFCSDSEGPLCLNDNAFELTKLIVPKGERLFAFLSAYDDYLVDIIKKKDYKPGDTLKLILPFFKAYGAANEQIKRYCEKSVIWTPDAIDSIQYIKEKLNTFIITTSYAQFAYPMYQGLGIAKENIYATQLDIDNVHIDKSETKRLKEICQEIIAMPEPVFLSEQTKADFRRLDEIFWDEIISLNSGSFLRNINVVGGDMKACAILDSIKKTGVSLGRVMFVGDSITDVDAFGLVKEAGGVAISFNGNAYAVKEADIACIAPSALVCTALALVFACGGRDAVYNLVEHWDIRKDILSKHKLPADLIGKLTDKPSCVEFIKPDNIKELTLKSRRQRKLLRGRQIGELG